MVYLLRAVPVNRPTIPLPAEVPHDLSSIQVPATLNVILPIEAITHQSDDSSLGPAAHQGACVAGGDE